jgi:23S rRNA pseudouridine2457 synthase
VTTIALNKPFDVLTSFTAPANAKPGQSTLSDFIKQTNVWPIGRLDRDSEGLLILSSNARLRATLLDPQYRHPRTYLVQVEGEPADEALERLEAGIELDGIRTRPARAESIDEPEGLWPRTPPIRFRASIPTSWIALTLTEGRNRQVRRMTAAVGVPTLRLIRASIMDLDLFELGLDSGESRVLTNAEASRLTD